MRKLFLLFWCFLLIIPSEAWGDTGENNMQAAFIRSGYLWLKTGNVEEQITAEPAKFNNTPTWSYDGQWLLYEKETTEIHSSNMENSTEIWVYNVQAKMHKKIFQGGGNAKWAPSDNKIAFTSNSVLNISDLKEFHNVALGVDDFNWYPAGTAFIVSSSAVLRPDGWTSPILYKVQLPNDLEKLNLTEYVEPFFTIPKEIGNGKASIKSINATTFEFSPDGKWISFIVNPTASWSMDSDMVCVISADGKNFEVLDEMILHLDVPKWAPGRNLLGYIAGGGRIVLGFKNKKLKVTELPAYKTMNLTPAKFAEMGFTWVDNERLVASRVDESEWSNDPQRRPEPTLCLIQLNKIQQTRITYPKKSIGDYDPLYIKNAHKLTWIRKKLAQQKGDIWIADLNGKNAKVWAKDVEQYSFYVK
ncbi:WD40 repeat protein [Cytobacillus firmus]|uniref:WD40 repeat protein n=2 Tax=Cytobacillus TaxID=2675230 RepID=A0A366K406_CYTFI|nr:MULTISPECIES: PD40 domain-containing protein [Cytobacillus]RBP96496.1 WD40 repeat protein [Cytobacillus firmus]TDX45777.1 WD40 repeat protein [Cytobacillus oceanisediminis]